MPLTRDDIDTLICEHDQLRIEALLAGREARADWHHRCIRELQVMQDSRISR